MRQANLIAILTDFGPDSGFVGILKGVIKKIAPQVQIVDLCNSITKYDIMEASLILSSAVNYFPEGTVFLAVVDPGVGTSRRPLAIRGERHLFVLPDNGLITMVRTRERLLEAVLIERFKPRSNTFHARDVFAPAAAVLTREPIESLGPPVPLESIRFLEVETPLISESRDRITVRGKVIYIDPFGNLITNISADDLEYVANISSLETLKVKIKGRVIEGISSFYDRNKPLVALIDSFDLLEIAIPQGNASKTLNVSVNQEVILEAEK